MRMNHSSYLIFINVSRVIEENGQLEVDTGKFSIRIFLASEN
jgi:hypothetical protein